MSAQQHLHAAHADHGHGHEEHDDLHVTMGDYVKGFVLAVVLTVIPFWLVMAGVIQDKATLVVVLGVLAAVQIIVHMVYFLHMNGKIQGGWTLLSTIFAVVFVAVTISGTLWVMFHMNAHMMPDHANPMAPASAPAHRHTP
ncbi:cytochrome bo3 quinol oxidase subunit 4 [Oryzisolibacter propanilivorax]|uniref:Cytochrome bo(3) ubiquinol oxidase subunit 4 n=1 Tax=Oryzisolibacter propanilivorax TaxID=1527607 RepID=A0A1G9UDL7_9BURK|nr:cytochrome o ubiquinol oxidase subunit IV [Oryzisolibacter propanilivorax]SDM57655.1 cytochrome bo3 quinol oxidase subunit 4 [Oryzisolibacter propanilivorax]